MHKLTLLAALLVSSAANAQTVGLDIGSHHFPDAGMHDANPGVYLRLDNGASAGLYRNSLSRLSAWAGYTTDWGPFALTVGAVSGYQRQHVITTVACKPSQHYTWCGLDTVVGTTRGALGLLVAPSLALPSVLGVTPRVTVIPKLGANTTVVHLSVEHTF